MVVVGKGMREGMKGGWAVGYEEEEAEEWGR